MKSVSIKRNIIYNTIYQILTILIPFITTPYISRVIGATGIGIYSYTSSIQTFFTLFAALGTVSYGAREIARNRDNESVRSKLFWEIEILTILTSSICIIAWGILIAITNEHKIIYIILTMNLLNTIFDISWFYSGLEQFKYTILQNSLFKILGTVLLFVFIKNPNDLVLYIFIMSLTTLLGTISMWIYLPKFIKKVKLKELKVLRHFKETLKYFIPTIATSIYTVLDKTLIGLITKNSDENGYYEQATKIINVAKNITFVSLNTVLSSRTSYLFAERKYDEIKEKIKKSINFILFIGLGTCFGLIGVIDNFVPIFFGEGYNDVSILIKLLSPIIIIVGISHCLGSQYYTPAGLRLKSAKFIIIGAIINFILNLVLIPGLWSKGAVIATIIAELTITLLYLKNCNNFYNIKSLVETSWKKIISAIIMLVCIVGINFINLNLIIKMSIQIVIGSAVYIISLLLLKDDLVIDTIKNILSKIKSKRKEVIV